MTFPISECVEAGQHTRNLARWALRLLRAANEERKSNVVQFHPARRAYFREAMQTDIADALRARREYRMILRAMRDKPGFLEGYRGAME